MEINIKSITVIFAFLTNALNFYGQCDPLADGFSTITVSSSSGVSYYTFSSDESECNDGVNEYRLTNTGGSTWINYIILDSYNGATGVVKINCSANNTGASRSHTFKIYGQETTDSSNNATKNVTITQGTAPIDNPVKPNDPTSPTSPSICGFQTGTQYRVLDTYETFVLTGNFVVINDCTGGVQTNGYSKPVWVTNVNFDLNSYSITLSPNLTANERTGTVSLQITEVNEPDDATSNLNIVITQPSRSPEYFWYPDSDGDTYGDYNVEAIYSLTVPFSNAVNNNLDLCPYFTSTENNGCSIPQENMNTITNEIYDITGNVISKGRSYFDDLGKSIQSQTWDVKTNKVWTTQTLYDEQGRPALNTSSAPTGNSIVYKDDFIINSTGNTFSEDDLGNIHDDNSLNDDPSELGSNEGTLGHYYSESISDPNTDAETGNHLKDITTRPYSRVFYDELNPGKTLKTVGGNKVDTDGDGTPDSYPQGFSHTMPAAQELYYAFGKDNMSKANINEIEELNVTTSNIGDYLIVNPHIKKTVAIDSHGEEVVSFASTDGQVLATARSGEGSQKQITSLIGELGFVDIHLPKGCEGSLNYLNSTDNLYTVYDLKTGKKVDDKDNLPAGVYRIQVDGNSESLKNITYIDNGGSIQPLWFIGWIKGVTYNINYYDYSLNYYDEAGNLTSTLPPIGFDNDAYADYELTGEVTHIKENQKSHFEYNSLGQLLETSSPDEGTAWFKYRTDGQIRFSQNSKQRTFAPKEFSYTNYDSKGRPVESGVYIENSSYDFNGLAMGDINSIIDNTYTYSQYVSDDDPLKNNYCYEQHFTLYDVADVSGLATAFNSSRNSQYGTQSFVAGNVSKTFTQNPATTATWYSYDIYGRVKWIVQDIEGLDGVKTIDYEYDDVTGAVTKVYYQKGVSSEQFIHRYSYDEDDYSLVQVETSTDDENFTIHANYEYYETGGLKRTVLAEGLQGIDYVYNLNGALKAINHPSLDPTKDPGGDGDNGVKPDVFGMHLDYYKGDYNRSGNNIYTSNAGADQYNGNIKAVRWNNKATDEEIENEKTYVYSYDRNNWLTQAQFGENRGGNVDGTDILIKDQEINNDMAATNSITLQPTTPNEKVLINPNSVLSIAGFTESTTDDYGVSNITYDANGNIQTLKRNKDTQDTSNEMDNMEYHYDTNKPNQLKRVQDLVIEETGEDDIKPQDADNYTYNAIGQLTHNDSEGIDYIYNAAGLVTEVLKDNSTVVKFFYNDRGQRVKKESYRLTTGALYYTQIYVRDAAGTPMAIYTDGVLTDHTVYGASRLGVYDRTNIQEHKTTYELTDHLGNVRALVKQPETSNEFYEIGGADYYPFGMPMPLRNSLSDYRYAYQGQEKDSETGKEAFQLRLWDARIGRWLTTDPYGEFASPYLGMGNNPISLTDPDGGKTSCPDCDPPDVNGGTLREVIITSSGRDLNFDFSGMPAFMNHGGLNDHWNTEYKGDLTQYNAEFGTAYSADNAYNEWRYQNYYQPARAEMAASIYDAQFKVGVATLATPVAIIASLELIVPVLGAAIDATAIETVSSYTTATMWRHGAYRLTVRNSLGQFAKGNGSRLVGSTFNKHYGLNALGQATRNTSTIVPKIGKFWRWAIGGSVGAATVNRYYEAAKNQ